MKRALSCLCLPPGYASKRSGRFSLSPRSRILLAAVILKLSGMAEFILWLGLIDSHTTFLFAKRLFLSSSALRFLVSKELNKAFVTAQPLPVGSDHKKTHELT